MQNSDRISLGALIVSVISIIVAGTTVMNRNTYDLGALQEAVGDASKPSGLYAQIDLAKRDALTAKRSRKIIKVFQMKRDKLRL